MITSSNLVGTSENPLHYLRRVFVVYYKIKLFLNDPKSIYLLVCAHSYAIIVYNTLVKILTKESQKEWNEEL